MVRLPSAAVPSFLGRVGHLFSRLVLMQSNNSLTKIIAGPEYIDITVCLRSKIYSAQSLQIRPAAPNYLILIITDVNKIIVALGLYQLISHQTKLSST